jgi:hypothetical protein
MRAIGRLISLATCVALLNACASTTVIRSTHPEAKIYIDGEYKGTGTATHTDQKIVGSTTHVRLEAPNAGAAPTRAPPGRPIQASRSTGLC